MQNPDSVCVTADQPFDIDETEAFAQPGVELLHADGFINIGCVRGRLIPRIQQAADQHEFIAIERLFVSRMILWPGPRNGRWPDCPAHQKRSARSGRAPMSIRLIVN